MQLVVIAPILEFLFDPLADFKAIIGSHCHIAGIKEFVNISAEEFSIRDLMLLNIAVVADVSRFECRQSSFTGDRAAPIVRIQHDDAETSLAEARADERWRSESRR